MNFKPIFEVLSVLKEYLIPHKKIASKFQNLKNLEDLKIFIQERSALVTQTNLYGYLKTRMGLKYTLMFTDKVFLGSVDTSKWNIYSAALCDCTLYVYSYLHVKKNLINLRAKETLYEILEEEKKNGMPDKIVSNCKNQFEQRLNEINWNNYYKDNPFEKSGQSLYEWAPVAEDLKILDKEIVLNSMKNKWNLVTAEFEKRSKEFEIN